MKRFALIACALFAAQCLAASASASGGNPNPGPSQPSPTPNANICATVQPAGVYCQGTVVVGQTFVVDFENGKVGNPPGGDLFFEAQTNDELYLSPVHGAKIWIGDGGAAPNCAKVVYSPDRVPYKATTMPAGTNFCIKTDQGRITAVVIKSITGDPAAMKNWSLTLKFTTFK